MRHSPDVDYVFGHVVPNGELHDVARVPVILRFSAGCGDFAQGRSRV